MHIPDSARRTGRQLQSALRNAVEVARFGGLATGEIPSPFQVVARTEMFRLRRYFPTEATGPALVLIPPLMMSAEVYDISRDTSAVSILRANGVDPWVIDFGAPEREEGGLGRDVADHILAISDAIDEVRGHTGADVHLGGYSQGGMFAYQAAAYRRCVGLASLVTFGAPVDSRQTRAFGPVSENLVVDVASAVADHVLVHVSVPAWANRLGFRLLDPVKSVRTRVDFLRQLHDREALLPRERQRQFLDNNGYVAYPGPAIAELVKGFVAHNRMLSGGMPIGETVAALADITCPVLAFIGTVDTIAPPASVRAIGRAAPAAAIYECWSPTGHFGLVVGSGAARDTWPTVAAWVGRSDGDPMPPDVVPLAKATGLSEESAEPALPTLLGAGLETGAAAISAGRAGASSVLGGVRTFARLGIDLVRSTPGLSRLEALNFDSKVSLSALLNERARHNGSDVFFVFADRGHTYAAADDRVNAVVRGLISGGVRHSQRVGVLMGTRPSALTAVAALNRIGAVVAMLRPDGPSAREADLAGITRVVADPEHVDAALAIGLPVLVLGARAGDRGLPEGVLDLEAVDHTTVTLPSWYVADPGTAADPAFLLFTGQGPNTRMTRITNGRWARSAFGTAAAAQLRVTDTVYSVTPLHHASGLLTAVGGALAGRARLALATAGDPDTFWTEVRRYGVTVVSYTWTLLHDLIEAEPSIGERHHPIRLFIGSGMPAWLWQRSRDRFASVGVLEFFVAGAAGVVLVNTSGDKIGAKGRPLPGSAAVRLIRYDLTTGQIKLDEHGRAQDAAVDEVGLLIAEPAPDCPSEILLRGLFAPGDRWASTEHLFRRDADRDYWLFAHTADVVRTADGPGAPDRAEDALGALPEVAMVAAYGLVDQPGNPQILVAALTLRPGRSLSTPALNRALAPLAPADRPAVIRLVPTIPRTTWWRPDRAELRRAGAPVDAPGWRRDPLGEYGPVAGVDPADEQVATAPGPSPYF